MKLSTSPYFHCLACGGSIHLADAAKHWLLHCQYQAHVGHAHGRTREFNTILADAAIASFMRRTFP